MELEERPSPIDPEVRAYVYSLVSALGGTGTDEDGRYVLGDDALACLKDLKRWLKLYDEKANRLDVARCLAEANLVEGDLLEILGPWPEESTDDRFKSKIALACLELLVPLTWPIEKDDTQMTVNHHRHIPYIQLAQTSYKRAILESQSKTILRTIVRIALPSIAIPMRERTSRDEGIIRFVLYLFRNVTIITGSGGDKENPTSRSSTIEAFHDQDVLALVLTICSNMGEDFNTQDMVIIELLFHLLKGINVEKLFMDDLQFKKTGSDELGALLAKEKNMHRSYMKHAPSRHNRFGTMIWVKRDQPGKVSTVSGQDSLTDPQQTMRHMDQSKKWNKPRQGKRDVEKAMDRFDVPVTLTHNANTHLRQFVEEFLDSGFNPLSSHVRKAIEREADRVLEIHRKQHFFLISWFLEAERVRRRKKHEARKKSKDKKITETFEADSFALIASVLNQETFLLLNRNMQDAFDMKDWQRVHAGNRCFTQILLVVQDMVESSLEEDKEIAENIQNRIFYEETTHDRIIAILREYKDQGFGYLDSCTELSHVFLRMLERYSRENVDLQVRSKRRAQKKKQKAEAVQNGVADANQEADDDAASEMEEIAEAQQTSRERKFDFNRFAAKFMTQSCIDTYMKFLRYYNDLNTEQLKRAHRFVYRVAFKQELSVFLFRVDYFALFNRMIKGPEPLDRVSPMLGEWEELVKQLIRRMVKKLQERPELAVEMLFTKIPQTAFYLENGYEKQTIKSRSRAPAALEVRGGMARDEQIGVVVAVLGQDESHRDAVEWMKTVLSSAASERQSWEAEAAARRAENDPSTESSEADARPPSIVVKPDGEEGRIAMFKNARLRLLMTLAGFERLGIDDEPDATWIIPSALTARQLHETHDVIQKHGENPVLEYGDDDPIRAEDMLRRKPMEKARRAAYDDDESGDGGIPDNDDDLFFPGGGPTNTGPRTAAAALEQLKKKRRIRRRKSIDSDDEDDGMRGLDDETRERRRMAREAADLEKRRKIKSEEFVFSSDEDEEADREFFAREETRRHGHAKKVMEVLREGMVGQTGKRKSDRGGEEAGEGRRKKQRVSEDESEDEADVLMAEGSSSPRIHELEDESEMEDEETPLSSPPMRDVFNGDALKELPINVRKPEGSTAATKALQPASTDTDEEDEDDAPIMVQPRRRNNRATLLFESESE
ncbi:MAG: hypothetical protein LQ350_004606 [Teloschistes chrysophthalmus]|nr:MAG: hypothetical protein LQ350_004606 [Niorma chrysophthalma]